MKSMTQTNGVYICCDEDFAIREGGVIAGWVGLLHIHNHTESDGIVKILVEADGYDKRYSEEITLRLEPMSYCAIPNEISFDLDSQKFFGVNFVKNYVLAMQYRTSMSMDVVSPAECLPNYTHYMAYAKYNLNTGDASSGIRKVHLEADITEYNVNSDDGAVVCCRYLPIASCSDEDVKHALTLVCNTLVDALIKSKEDCVTKHDKCLEALKQN